MEAEAGENKKQGEAFLAENKTKDGVKTLPSGLEYKVLTEGTGPKPTASDTVECNYRGTLIDGKEFDSSDKHGGPATFPVSGVIKGWTEALQLMPVGSKWQLFIPPDLAYGDRGAGPDIGPDSTLIFDVELVSIKQPEKEGSYQGQARKRAEKAGRCAEQAKRSETVTVYRWLARVAASSCGRGRLARAGFRPYRLCSNLKFSSWQRRILSAHTVFSREISTRDAWA